MKFTWSWLKEYLDTNASVEEICDKLTAIGLELEEMEDRSEGLKEFKSVEVIDCVPHEDSDHLNVCKVKKADGEILQVVCGAPNAHKGMKAVLAEVGAYIPALDLKIKKAKVRGVESCGMLCSERELGLGEDHDGIIDLPQDTELGLSVAEIYNLDDPVIDINVTPDRGDCLGVYGIARDLWATEIGKLNQNKIKTKKHKTFGASPITPEINTSLCPFFAGRYIKSVKNCESPQWMKDKLAAVGMKSISALVDITNYVMMCIGRPMHVYDADKITGDKIIVRTAIEGGENITGLDEVEYKVEGSKVVIADVKNGLGIGGIIGGMESGCLMDTTNVFLESALFDAVNIAKTGRALNVQTDARYRFERGVDPEMVIKGIEMATDLILEICGGEVSDIVTAGEKPVSERTTEFDTRLVEGYTATKIYEDRIIDILEKLGFECTKKSAHVYSVKIPSWRHDVDMNKDLVEEVIRIHGLDKIPALDLPRDRLSEKETFSLTTAKYQGVWKAKKALASNGMSEVLTWSFMEDNKVNLFGKTNEYLYIQNPIISELNHMRPTIIPNLLDTYKRNRDRGFKNISIFESGSTFLGSNAEDQKLELAGIRVGRTSEKNIYQDDREFDAFDVKKDAMDALEALGVKIDSLQITRNAPDYYHPKRSGSLGFGKNIIACFGELHPATLKDMEVGERVNAFEIYVDNIPFKQKADNKGKYDISDLPVVTRDFAFILNVDVAASDVIRCINGTEKQIDKTVKIFDVYEGDKMEEGKKSIALTVTIQPKQKTLTGEEIDYVSSQIIKAVTNKLGGKLRDGE